MLRRFSVWAVDETHNWGSTVAFWRDLGYELEFETDHNLGRLRHPLGGPYIFIAERPQGHTLQVTLGLAVEDFSFCWVICPRLCQGTHSEQAAHDAAGLFVALAGVHGLD
jgi:hypothetical protein